ncbi:MAG: hypothetical protein GW818_09535 [Flavobacteriales bacterium]|nr:hypothetical protein [Flavobacteriales bacterium]NCQ11971.1 hypothetical protein [Bacteroidota bacterium]
MKKTILILIFFILNSCVSINEILEKDGIFNEKVEIKNISNTEKNVIFIGMHHFGRKEFYTDVANKTDSLQKNGYITFYESVTLDSSLDSLTTEIYKKKLRKIIGLKSVKYYDTISKKIVGKYRYKGEYNLINQPKYSDLNVNMEKALNIDATVNTLIDEFEKQYGAIKLSECDKKTTFNSEKYKCRLMDKGLRYRFKSEFGFDYRNQNLANEINDFKGDKILIIYGKAHYEGLINKLQKIDSRWK